ncbi:MAG: ABC transporter ATP-binding protein [Candidatus Amulumruptor caecigallinarius]|nr:ABC transporter ATP-binding protein [Candidatus Amulumruptor caecigallinarius]MCM1396903.1 ABC transporter ATP-binding protein [Candidatus Amulumruptor caecigallinarius]MCM1454153.1 ABC transporter ATP-binding protein [bacterium]
MISIRNISKAYGTLRVLDDVSLDIADAEVLAIVGPSGAGKTTLLQIMGTIEKPDSGEVAYGSTLATSLSGARLARFRNANIGFVFQYHRLLPEFSLLENIMMPALIGGSTRKAAEAHARELADTLGLAKRLSHRPAELSGGECQRAAVARALINNPMVVLADEPSGSLDSRNRRELHTLFFDLRRSLGQTFVIVTHDEALAADCDRIVHLRDGRIEGVTDNAPSLPADSPLLPAQLSL